MFNVNALQPRSLQSLVENQTTFTLDQAALHLFETHMEAHSVSLQFGNPVLASMIQGRKVMHLRERPGFNFIPGESIMLPNDERMIIDFPDAKKGSPTKCLALEVAPEEIRKITNQMNEHRPLCGDSYWHRDETNFHFTN
ncbi:MAG: AraC family transcriptional regulator N-terminal domain-containing protein, partial [Bacteroidota bacterium]